MIACRANIGPKGTVPFLRRNSICSCYDAAIAAKIRTVPLPFTHLTIKQWKHLLIFGQGVPKRVAATEAQRAERPRLGQSHQHGAAEPRAPGEIVDRAKRPVAPGLLNPLHMRRRHAREHVQAETKTKIGGQGAGSREYALVLTLCVGRRRASRMVRSHAERGNEERWQIIAGGTALRLSHPTPYSLLPSPLSLRIGRRITSGFVAFRSEAVKKLVLDRSS